MDDPGGTREAVVPIKRLRSLHRLRHATIVASVCGHASVVGWMWMTPGIGGGVTALPVVGAFATALLLPSFYLSLSRVADTLRASSTHRAGARVADGRGGAPPPSLGALDVWVSCLLPFWSMFGIPVLMVRIGKVVAQSADAPHLPRHMTILAVLHGIASIASPFLGLWLWHSWAGALVQCIAGVVVFALASRLLLAPLDEAVAGHRLLSLGGVGNDEPIAVKTL